MNKEVTICPCGSENKFIDCCEPVLQNLKKAKTPEQVMRARYSAFVIGDIAFLKSSSHPSNHADFNATEIAQWSEAATWQGLSIINTESIDSDQGKVEFVARYSLDRKNVNHHEIALFVKEDNTWFFKDGTIINDSIKREGPKVGRNDPCVCGSGKKYKKCCGV